MKRTITVLTAACLCLASYAAIVIRGTIAPDLGNKVSLYAINDGLDSLCATAQVTRGKFVLKSAVPYNGLYVLSTDENNKLKHAIYLKDGAQLAVNYGRDLIVQPTNANAHEKDFALWATKSAPVFYHAYLYNHTPGGKTVKPQQFLKEMEVLKQTAAALKRKANGKGDKNSLLQLKIDADLAFYMLSYRKNNPDAVDDNFISPAALQDYKQLFSDKSVLRLPYAPEMLALYVDYLAEKQNIGKEDYRQRLSLLSSEPLREAYLYQVAQGLNYDEKYTALLRAWGDTPLSSRLQQALKPIEQALAWSKVGQTAIDFRGIRGIPAIAFDTDAVLGLTGEDAADGDLFPHLADLFRHMVRTLHPHDALFQATGKRIVAPRSRIHERLPWRVGGERPLGKTHSRARPIGQPHLYRQLDQGFRRRLSRNGRAPIYAHRPRRPRIIFRCPRPQQTRAESNDTRSIKRKAVKQACQLAQKHKA